MNAQILSAPHGCAGGCIAGDMLIHMGDGSQRRADEIRIGDRIRSADGQITVVQNVFCGTEQYMTKVTTEGERILVLTAGHPVASERGVVTAEGLSVNDKLLLEDKTVDPVSSIEKTEYNNTVYNFEFENGSLMIANGVHVGGFML